MFFNKSFLVMGICASMAAVMVSMIGSPSKVRAQEPQDIEEAMSELDKVFVDLMKAVLLHPVQELENEIDFTRAQKRASEIVRLARLVRTFDTYKDDDDFQKRAKAAEKAGQELGDSAQKKTDKETLSAAMRLRTACIQCHKNFRF